MTREEIVAFFERRDESWRRKDADGLAADFSEDAVLESPIGGTARGRSAIREAQAKVLKAFQNLEMRRSDLVIDGDRTASSFQLSGTHSGEFLGVQPTGKKVKIRGVSLITIDGAKITHERRIYDFTGYLVKTGVLKVKPA